MGQFSWLDCKTGEQVLDGVRRKVYVLVPKEFGGGHIEEKCYDGYGRFGGKDVYDLVADWNRKYISYAPDHLFPSQLKNYGWMKQCVATGSHEGWDVEVTAFEKKWYKPYSDLSKTREQVVAEVGEHFEWRYIGIALACYDEDNAALPFPIKITHDADAVYEDCEPSKRDPMQGWKY